MMADHRIWRKVVLLLLIVAAWSLDTVVWHMADDTLDASLIISMVLVFSISQRLWNVQTATDYADLRLCF
jgi:hypothetical protein